MLSMIALSMISVGRARARARVGTEEGPEGGGSESEEASLTMEPSKEMRLFQTSN